VLHELCNLHGFRTVLLLAAKQRYEDSKGYFIKDGVFALLLALQFLRR